MAADQAGDGGGSVSGSGRLRPPIRADILLVGLESLDVYRGEPFRRECRFRFGLKVGYPFAASARLECDGHRGGTCLCRCPTRSGTWDNSPRWLHSLRPLRGCPLEPVQQVVQRGVLTKVRRTRTLGWPSAKHAGVGAIGMGFGSRLEWRSREFNGTRSRLVAST